MSFFSGALNKISVKHKSQSQFVSQYFESQMDLMLFWTPLDFHCKDKNSWNVFQNIFKNFMN